MSTDIMTACEVLRASGVKRGTLLGLWLPLGREQRIQTAARRRHSVLEAKNLVLDTLARGQKPLTALDLRTAQQAREALRDPESRHLIVTLGLNRAVLEDEADRYGAELGASFTEALNELVRERRLLRLAGVFDAPGGEIYLLIPVDAKRRYDLTPLNRLLHQGEEYGDLLRSREKASRDQDRGRTYRIEP